MDHKFQDNPDRFCYIRSDVVLPDRQAKITDFVKKAYRNYLGVKQGDQVKLFSPDDYCKTCVEKLKD